MAKTVININKDTSTELTFDVDVKSEMGGEDSVKVRFVIIDIDGFDWTLDCVQDGKQWIAKIPAFEKDFDSRKFRIEVIVDEFYFEPVKGIVQTGYGKKPEVDVDLKEDVQEGAATGAGEITGATAPTNALLVPEFPAASNEKSSLIKRPEDEDTDEDKLTSSVSVAEQIIHKLVGKIESPSKSGFLLNRDKTGHVIVPGLHTADKKAIDRSNKVKEILKKIN